MKKSVSWEKVCIGSLFHIFLTSCATAAQQTSNAESTATLSPPTSTPIPPTATHIPPTATPIPPTATAILPTKTPVPTSCEEVEGDCLELSFDGESCVYQGLTELKTGHVTFIFNNVSEAGAAANMVRHTGDETIQDMKDTFVEEPSTGHAPAWTEDIKGVWRALPPGKSHFWEGVLEPGIYTLVCARITPLGVWFGTGLTVVV